MNLDEYERIKREVDVAKSDAEREAGVIQEQLRSLKQEFGEDSLEAAEILLEKETQVLAQLESDYTAEMVKFREVFTMSDQSDKELKLS